MAAAVTPRMLPLSALGRLARRGRPLAGDVAAYGALCGAAEATQQGVEMMKWSKGCEEEVREILFRYTANFTLKFSSFHSNVSGNSLL